MLGLELAVLSMHTLTLLMKLSLDKWGEELILQTVVTSCSKATSPCSVFVSFAPKNKISYCCMLSICSLNQSIEVGDQCLHQGCDQGSREEGVGDEGVGRIIAHVRH